MMRNSPATYFHSRTAGDWEFGARLDSLSDAVLAAITKY